MSTAASFTNVSVQKFASEGDAALFERNWGQHGPGLAGKTGQAGVDDIHCDQGLEPG